MERREYRFNAAHPAYVELQQLADALDTTIQAVIDLQVIALYNLRHGIAVPLDVTWLTAVQAPSAVPAEAPPEPASNAGAAALADEWL
jgi:hypothetical protein